MIKTKKEYQSVFHRRYSNLVRYLFIPFFIFLLSTLSGQVPAALGLHPNAGVDRILMNPALGMQSPYTWDAPAFGGHFFAHTDYTFLRTASLLNLNGRINDAVFVDSQAAIPESSDIPLGLFDLDGGKKKMYLRGRITGPGITFDIGSDKRVGFFSNFRMHISSSDIPENFGAYELNESYRTNIIDVDPGSATAASWLEIGGHFSTIINNIGVGINIKYLHGHEGAYLVSDTDADYGFIDSVVITNTEVNFELGFTNSTINQNSIASQFNGSGFSFDLGFTGHTEILAFGGSLTDIGIITYSKNTEIYTPQILETVTQVRTQDFRGFGTIRNLLDQIQNDLNLTPDLSSSFTIGLPTRLTLYADYQYKKDIFVSGMIHQRIPIFKNSLKANNNLVITPRIEKGNVTYFFPLTIHEYSSFRLGAAFQFGPFIIGTDHLSSVLIPSDFRGSDIYFALNLWPFGQVKNSRGKGSNGIFCPTF